MLAHVYLFLRHGGTLERGLDHIFRLAHKGNHSAVGGLTWIHIKHLHALYRGDCSHDCVYN